MSAENPPDALVEHLRAALLAYSDGAYEHARDHAARAAQERPTCRVARALKIYFSKVSERGRTEVYATPEGFAAFIRGGGNVPLYERLSAALASAYASSRSSNERSFSLLDVGVGDGLALLPVLKQLDPSALTLVEPSGAMLARVSASLERLGVVHRAINATIEDFIDAADEQRWDIVQATFSLQCLSSSSRARVFEWLRARMGKLLIAEFDVPDFANGYSAERADYVIERFERGFAEYEGDETVAQGFLAPILAAPFDGSAERTSFEQPLDCWRDDLEEAGFASVRSEFLYDYWWAPAYLICAE